PHLARLAATGDFRPLATSTPPQSPVAWSNVIAGSGPGTHQIYDFIHRDPHPDAPGLAVEPYLSTSTTQPAQNPRELTLGGWRIPLSSETTQLRRQGPAFWERLVERGVDVAVYRMPANYPPREASGSGHFCCLTGMGTPDLLGSYGEFTLFTPEAPRSGRRVSGGKLVHLETHDHRAAAELEGPANFLRDAAPESDAPHMMVRFVAVRDPQRDLVKITIGDDLLMLKQGEWSRWVQVEFETGFPGSSVLGLAGLPTSLAGMVRFHVNQVHPDLVLFATPINIDPTRPANPISVPGSFSRELAEATGLYFTAGIPEHAPELQRGALDEDAWLKKADTILQKRIEQFRYALDRFESGCLFYYFGTIDVVSHLFWRDTDPQHPGREPQQGDRYAGVIEEHYVKMDQVVGQAVRALRPADTLLVRSDHGFASFRRGFNLNTWLLENGYLALLRPDRQTEDELLLGVDWSRTRAYGMGLNGLYLNLRGREKRGIVDSGVESRALAEELARKLLAVRDSDGSQVIARVDLVEDRYPGADPAIAPDLLVGYARNYRASWSTVLGGMPKAIFEDNHDRWSGDHCIAAELVPGILVSNRKIVAPDAALTDIAPTILALFGVPQPAPMTGRAILAPAR
ncbi:MAG: alkaline phosphatase family protein, partial [Pirellulales bacterium]